MRKDIDAAVEDIPEGMCIVAADVVTTTGTPANNQLAIWTSDGVIEGDANILWDGNDLYIND